MTEKFTVGKIEQLTQEPQIRLDQHLIATKEIHIPMPTIVDKAKLFARAKHVGHLDDDGQDYFTAHLWHVASIVEIAKPQDQALVAAAYLHDTLEDTDTTYEELKENFGQRVADLVHEVTHDGEKDNYGRYFPRLKTRDAIVLKLADRISNLLRMDSWPEKRKEQYLRKTKFWKDGTDR